MKGKKHKIASLFLSLMMVVTSMNVIPQNIGMADVKAEEVSVDLTDVTVDTVIVNGGDADIINALGMGSMVIDGVSYQNYTAYKGVTAFASSEKDGASKAIDQNAGTRWETEHGVDPQYLTVDLGNLYSIKDIAIYWEAASAKEYTVEVSADGSDFQTLTQVTDSHGKRTDNLKLSKEIKVRSIRIYCTARNTAYGDSIYEIGLFGNDPQGEVVPILSNLKVRDYYKYTGKYIIYFNEAAESSGYNVYIDDTENKVKTVAGSGYYLSEKEISNLSPGQHTLYVANTDDSGKESAMICTKFTVEGNAGTNTDIAQVYIDTEKSISSEYHENADVTISVIDKDGGMNKDLVDSKSNIKIRGNTTAGAPKKPWNIKLSGKEKLLGMEKGKKWCLLANAFDKSLMRNSLVLDFGLENGVYYNSQNRYAEVYLNGKFQGNYLITEAVEAKTERVDIDAYNAESNDILLELGTRNEPDVDHFTTDVLRTTFDVNDPEKGDDLTDDQVNAKIEKVKEYLNQFETALRNQNYDEILNYIDEDTFVNFYIVNELFKNVDFNFSSTRFYIKDNKIYAGPCWDYDLSSGNCKSTSYKDYYVDGVSYKGYYCQSMNWYRQLLKIETFYNKVKERYKELQYKIQNIYKTDSETDISVKYLVDNYGASFERNYKSTEDLGAGWLLTNDDGYSYAAESGWTKWQQPIEFLRSWLENRNIWLCDEWGIDMAQAYEDSIPEIPEEPETTKEPETTTEQSESQDKRVVAFEYDGSKATVGDDMAEYADSENDYIYHASSGNGTMTASITGINLKHMEWGDDADYGFVVPVVAAGIKNPWSADAYVAYTFSTKGYTGLSASVDVGGTKKGPANLNIGYYDADGSFQSITTYTIAKNKTMYTIDFELPEKLENQDSITIYIKLADTTNIGGNEMTDSEYITGGELAINNFVVVFTDEIPIESETTPQETTPAVTTSEETTPQETVSEIVAPTETETPRTTESKTAALPVPQKNTSVNSGIKVAKGKVKKATKKKNAVKIKLTFKKLNKATKYQVKISKTKKFQKKKTITKLVKKRKVTLKVTKFRSAKKLYVKVRGVNISGKKKCYGTWSKRKAVKIK